MFATLLTLAALSAPATQSSRDLVRVTALGGGRVRLVQGQTRQVADLSRDINGCTARLYDSLTGTQGDLGYSLRVLDLASRGQFWYLLLEANSGPNCNVQGECGAATNTDVLWLKLSRKLQVLEKRVLNVEDCRRGTVLLPKPGEEFVNLSLNKGVLDIALEEGGEVQHWRYRRTQPQLGLQRP